MSRLLALLSLLLIFLTPSSGGATPVVWDPNVGGNGHYYDLVFFEKTSTSWVDARGLAATSVFLGASGHLATINSAEEDEFLKATFGPMLAVQTFGGSLEQNTPGDFAWIGLSDEAIEGVFRWASSEPLVFTNWGPFEPGGPGDPAEDYVHVRILNDLRLGTGPKWEWNDLPQDVSERTDVARIGYIVEFEPTQCNLDLIACEATRAEAENQLDVVQQSFATCEASLTAIISDADVDGVRDLDDDCPDSAAGAEVDRVGCSLAQFCGSITVQDSVGSRTCKRADWQNDEPLMTGRTQDCVIDRGGAGRDDDRCVPRP